MPGKGTWDMVSLELGITDCNLEDGGVCRGKMRDKGSSGRQDSWMGCSQVESLEHHVYTSWHSWFCASCLLRNTSILLQQHILENVAYSGEGNKKVPFSVDPKSRPHSEHLFHYSVVFTQPSCWIRGKKAIGDRITKAVQAGKVRVLMSFFSRILPSGLGKVCLVR